MENKQKLLTNSDESKEGLEQNTLETIFYYRNVSLNNNVSFCISSSNILLVENFWMVKIIALLLILGQKNVPKLIGFTFSCLLH